MLTLRFFFYTLSERRD